MYRLSSGFIIVSLALALATTPVDAELISLKTVSIATPVAAGDQFRIILSGNLPMRGVSLDLNAPLLDPLVNPARRAAIDKARMITAPTFYSISVRAGGFFSHVAPPGPLTLIDAAMRTLQPSVSLPIR